MLFYEKEFFFLKKIVSLEPNYKNPHFKMRKSIFLFAFLCFAFTITSCSNDDNETTPPTVVDPFAGNSSIEDAVITISNDDIDVAAIGGVMIKSTPLVANGDIEMTVPATESLAFPEEGFKIELAPQNDFDGIYVQLDGATDYLDIPKSSLTLIDQSTGKTSARNEDANYELNIDLGSEVTPGTFCYDICIYDSFGNISNPIEVCVTVKFFGGNSALVGEWNLNTVKIAEGDTNSEYAPGETTCKLSYTEECDGEKQLNQCDILPGINVVFNQDGTYISKFISNGTDYYEGLNYNTCEVVQYPSDEGDENEISTEDEGKWSYDFDGENQKRLILIIYKKTITYTDGTSEIDTYESGEAELAENVLNVIENSFDITFPEEEEDEGIRTYYFSK